jgi:hypothetical protein
MKEEAKSNIQPEREENQPGFESQIQTQEAAFPIPPNPNQTGIQNLTREEIIALQQTVGNRAVTRLLTQHQGDDGGRVDDPQSLRQDIPEDEQYAFPGPRSSNAREEIVEYPGPRSMSAREATVKQQGGYQPGSALAYRGVKMGGLKSVGDAHHLGDGLFGWDRAMSASDVRSLLTGLVSNQSSAIEGKPIYILSGTHGTEDGDLVNTGAGGFVGEDQATADEITSDPDTPEGTKIEVVDVNIFSKKEVTTFFGMSEWIRILAWCYSERSYKRSEDLKSNWWPTPDKL